MALRFLLRFPAFSQKEQNGPFFTFPWRFQKFLAALAKPRNPGFCAKRPPTKIALTREIEPLALKKNSFPIPLQVE